MFGYISQINMTKGTNVRAFLHLHKFYDSVKSFKYNPYSGAPNTNDAFCPTELNPQTYSGAAPAIQKHIFCSSFSIANEKQTESP